MKKLKILIKICLGLMLFFCFSYSVLFVFAKFGEKMDIENSNSIYL
jgi:hypothetical protein